MEAEGATIENSKGAIFGGGNAHGLHTQDNDNLEGLHSRDLGTPAGWVCLPIEVQRSIYDFTNDDSYMSHYLFHYRCYQCLS